MMIRIRNLLACGLLMTCISTALAQPDGNQPTPGTFPNAADPESLLKMMTPDLSQGVADGGDGDDAAIGMFIDLFGPFILLPYLPTAEQDRINSRADGEKASLLAIALGYMNLIAYVLAAAIIISTMASATIRTAAEGEPLGRRFSTVWLPLRNGLALVLLAPATGVGGGIFSLAQVFVVWMLIIGSTAGSSMWSLVLDQIKNNQSIIRGAAMEGRIVESYMDLAFIMACARSAEAISNGDEIAHLDAAPTLTTLFFGHDVDANDNPDPSELKTPGLFTLTGPDGDVFKKYMAPEYSRKSDGSASIQWDGAEATFLDGNCGRLEFTHYQNKPKQDLAPGTLKDSEFDVNWENRLLWGVSESVTDAHIKLIPEIYTGVIEPIFEIASVPGAEDAFPDEDKRLRQMYDLYANRDPQHPVRQEYPNLDDHIEGKLKDSRNAFYALILDKDASARAPQSHAFDPAFSLTENASRIVQYCVGEERDDANGSKCGAAGENWATSLDQRGWAMAGSWFFELAKIPRTSSRAMESFAIKTEKPQLIANAQNLCAGEFGGFWGSVKQVLATFSGGFWKSFCEDTENNIVVGSELFLRAAIVDSTQYSRYITQGADSIQGRNKQDTDVLWSSGLAWVAEAMMSGESKLGAAGSPEFDISTDIVDRSGQNVNPFLMLTNIGENAVTAAASLFAAAVTLDAIASILKFGSLISVKAMLGSIAIEWGSTLAAVVGGALWTCGVILSYLIPILPLITWVFLIASYALMAVECVAAAPLGVVMMCTPEGEGISGTKMQTAIQILATAILAPCLLIVGLLASLALSYVIFAYFHEIYWNFVIRSLGQNIAVLGFLMYFIMYVSISYQICRWCVSVMPRLPNSILAWFATGAGQRLGEFAGSDGSTQGVLGAAGGALSSAGSKVIGSATRAKENLRQRQEKLGNG